ncbi:MAG TPA: YfhO family protein [Blastocatellia bacterium]|nr:YfhO family protein [Blastocatellia bacterium]
MTDSIPNGAGLRSHLAVAALLVLVIVALFWRVFFLGETLIDLAAHQNQLPWGAATSTFDGYAFNRRDLTDTYVTRDYFVVRSFRDGELPLWNPYILGGHPIYADGVTKIFSPLNLLYRWFDVPLGYTLARLIELALAVAFLYLFLINLGISPRAAFVGCLVFLLSDHLMLRLTGLGWVGGLLWLPLMLLGADRALRKRKTLPAVGAGVAFALHFYMGFTPAAIYYVAALAGYYIVTAWLTADALGRWPALTRACRYLAVSLAVGFGLAAAIWMPVFELLGYSNRKIVPVELGYIWIPPWHLLTLVLPRAFGNAFDPQFLQMFVGVGVSQDRSVYLGIVTLSLIALALWRPSDRRVYYFAGLIAAALIAVTLAPVYVYGTQYVPVVRTIRAITRVNVLYAFGGAVLAAYGADRLLKSDSSTVLAFTARVRSLGFWLLGSLLVLAALFGALGRFLPRDVDSGGRLRRLSLKVAITLAENCRLSWGNVGLWVPLAVIVGLIALCWYFHRSRRPATALLSAMAVLLCIELVWNGSQYNPTFPRGEIYRTTAATDFLKSNIGNHRVVIAPAEFGGKAGAGRGRKIVAPPNTLIPYSIPTISGKDQLFPRWYRELTAMVEPQPELSHIVFSETTSPYYDLLGVKYVLTAEENMIDDVQYREVFNGEGVRIYENTGVMPRAFFAGRVRAVATPAEAIRVMQESGFDPHTTAVVQSAALDLNAVQPPDQSDRVEISSYRNNEVILKTSASGRRLLVLTDVDYAGWEVAVDEAPSELLRVDAALRGVIVPAGEHRVRFAFKPRSLRYGAAISLLTLLTTVAAVALVAANRRKATTHLTGAQSD